MYTFFFFFSDATLEISRLNLDHHIILQQDSYWYSEG